MLEGFGLIPDFLIKQVPVFVCVVVSGYNLRVDIRLGVVLYVKEFNKIVERASSVAI